MLRRSLKLSPTRLFVWSGLLCLVGGTAIVMGNLVTTNFEDPQQAQTFLKRTSLLESLDEPACSRSHTEHSCPASLVKASCSDQSSCCPAKNSSSIPAVLALQDSLAQKIEEKSAQQIVSEISAGGKVSEDLKPLVSEVPETVASEKESAVSDQPPRPESTSTEVISRHEETPRALDVERGIEMPSEQRGREPAGMFEVDSSRRGELLDPKVHHLQVAAQELDRAGMHDKATEIRQTAHEIQAAFIAAQERNQPIQVTGGQIQELQQTLKELREEVQQLRRVIETLKPAPEAAPKKSEK